jgi:hypothetical protein
VAWWLHTLRPFWQDIETGNTRFPDSSDGSNGTCRCHRTAVSQVPHGPAGWWICLPRHPFPGVKSCQSSSEARKLTDSKCEPEDTGGGQTTGRLGAGLDRMRGLSFLSATSESSEQPPAFSLLTRSEIMSIDFQSQSGW